jgi:foldase protein PrsA
MKNKNYILLGSGIAFLSIISFGLGVAVTNRPVPKLSDGKLLVAKLEGKDLTADEFYERLKQINGANTFLTMIDKHIADEEVETTTEMRIQAANEIEQLKNYYAQTGANFQDELLNNGFKDETELEAFYIQRQKATVVARNYYEANLKDSEIDKYYKDKITGKVTAKHILITPDVSSEATDAEKKAAEDKALETANEVIQKLKNGEKWDDLVAEYSEDTGTKDKNGELSFSQDEVVKEFWDGAQSLKEGEYTLTPVKSQFGYHIILKVENEGEKPSKEDSLTKIKKALTDIEMAKTNAVMKAWFQVRKEYKLEIFEEEIKKLYESVEATTK